MKKLSLLLIVLALGLGLKAQCPLTTAVDFTATDVHGTEVHLFDILDSGQYVMIDFFFTTCSACIQSIPFMVQSYQSMGCNMHDVFYMEVDTSDGEQACLNWVNNHGVQYPTIAGTSGGDAICNQYGITAYPTIILIAPDHSILIHDLWPINNVQNVISALESHGVQQHPCTTVPEVTINIDLVTETEAMISFTPNEECAAYYYTMATESEIQEWMSIAGLALPEYLQSYGFPGENEPISHTFNDLIPNTEYVIYAVPADADGNLYDVVQETLITTSGGAETIPEFTGTDIYDNEINLYSILDGGQAALLSFFLVDDDASAAIMPYITEAYRLFGCNEQDVFFMGLTPNAFDEATQNWVNTNGMKYPTISRTGGANTIAQSIPVGFYPTTMLVRPNHEIAVRDIYPITGTQTIIDALEGEGIEQHPCYDETLTFSMDTVTLPWCEVTWITVYNNTAEDATIMKICDDLYELGFYVGSEAILSCNETEITIPQGSSVELGIECCVTGKRAIIPNLVTVTSNLPEAQFVVMVDDTWSLDENEASATLFPNPANDFVTLKGENLGTVQIFNTLGQKVDEFLVEGDELNINTTNYQNGIYFIKSGEQVFRFVITH